MTPAEWAGVAAFLLAALVLSLRPILSWVAARIRYERGRRSR
jgi:hypothetical protein